MRITVITFVIFSLIVQGHGRPLRPGPGSIDSEDLPLMRRLPGKKGPGLADWFQRTSDRFWNSVIPGRPILAKQVVAGTSLIVIVLGLGLWLFIYVYRKIHSKYLKVQMELLQGKRVMRPEPVTRLYLKMLQKLVCPKQHQVVKKHRRDIEEGDDEEDQSRRPFLSWLTQASKYILKNELAGEESDSTDEEERNDEKPFHKGKAKKEEKGTVKKNYVAKMKRLNRQIKDKTVAIKKEVKEAKNIMAKKTKNIKVKEAKNILAKKTKNIMAKKTKHIKVKEAKKMAKKTKNTLVKKIKKIKNIKRRK